MPELSHPFEPVWDERSRILILGSFPSVLSRAGGFYYGNPRNRFWQVLSLVYEQDVPGDKEGKISFLLSRRLALWDALASCEVEGSADSDIKHALPNDLSRILHHAPVGRVIANGQLAGRAVKAYDQGLDRKLIILPSTSPANAAWSLQRLAQAWREALNG